MKKRIIALILSIAMVMSIAPTSMATEGAADNNAVEEANLPVEEIDENAPQVGNTIWIKNGSKIYKNTEDTEGYGIQLVYKIKITDIQTIGDTTWYKFEFADLSAIIGGTLLKGYEWVKAESTSVEEPTDEPVDAGLTKQG